MRQRYPKELRPNCLLTRHPICFVHGLKNIFNMLDYWNGVPEFLRSHGYEVHDLKGTWRGPKEVRIENFSSQFREILKSHEKIHIITHSMGSLDILEILMKDEFAGKISSATFVAPPFNGASTKKYKKPNDVLVGTIIPLESQPIGESLGVIFRKFPGDHIQVIGSGPWPPHLQTAHEMYLDHAILLAEHDYHTAKYTHDKQL